MQSSASKNTTEQELSSPTNAVTQENQRTLRVLVVDDEKLIADTVTHILNKNGFTASCVYNGEAALASVQEFCPDIVLSDVRMPGRNGVETAIMIQEKCPNTRIVLFSGQASTSPLVDQARKQGYNFTLLPKPIHPRELAQRLREL